MEPNSFGVRKGRAAPFSLRGEWSPEAGRGDSKHPSLPLAQRSVTGGDDFYKSYKPVPRDRSLHKKQLFL